MQARENLAIISEYSRETCEIFYGRSWYATRAYEAATSRIKDKYVIEMEIPYLRRDASVQEKSVQRQRGGQAGG